MSYSKYSKMREEEFNEYRRQKCDEFVYEYLGDITKGLDEEYCLIWMKIFRDKLDECIDLIETRRCNIDWL